MRILSTLPTLTAFGVLLVLAVTVARILEGLAVTI